MGIYLLACRLELAGVFAIAAVAKLRDGKGSRQALEQFGVPESVTSALAVLLPAAELVCAALLLVNRWVALGAFASLALLGIFTLAIVWNLARGRRGGCNCFGQISSAPLSWRTVVRNVALLGIAGFVFLYADQASALGWSALSMNNLTPGMLVLGAALALGLAYALTLLFQLMQQNGRLLLRLEAIEKKLRIDPESKPEPGLPEGSPAPEFEAQSLDGAAVHLESLQSGGKAVMLLFTELDCPACGKLEPDVRRWQEEYQHLFTVVPLSSNDRPGVHPFGNTLLQKNGSVARLYGAEQTPCAVMVQRGRTASALAVGPDAVRALAAHAALPNPVKKGDASPALKLADLAGLRHNLADLRGRKTLVLFWSTTCGYCTAMLPRVKAWPNHAPELLVISASKAEDHKAQGLPARVLLDPYSCADLTFGVRGTPSGVLIDESGRVASEVVAGEPAVWALAGVEFPRKT